MENLMPEEQESILVVVCISKAPLRGLPSEKHVWKRVELTPHAEATGALVVFYKQEGLQRQIHVVECTCSTVNVTFLKLTCEWRGLGGSREAETLLRMRFFVTLPPCTMEDVLDAGVVSDQDQRTGFHAWLVLGDTGHTGVGNALQAVALNDKMQCVEMVVACYDKLTVLGSGEVQIRVHRRMSIETTLLLELQTRGAETPAGVGEQARFLPVLEASGGAPKHWKVGHDYLRAWPKDGVPWQYVDMPRGQMLPRSIFNARVEAALRIVEEKREAVMPSPRTPDDARKELTPEQYERAWCALQELFMDIWRQDCPDTCGKQEWEKPEEYRARCR